MKFDQNPVRIACLGECMIELSDLALAEGRARLGVAGDTLNTAVYLARLIKPETASVRYLTALGADPFSDHMVGFMEGEGIDTTGIARFADELPGLYAITLDAEGERSFAYWRAQSAARSMFRPGGVPVSEVVAADLVYLSGISLAILPPKDRAALLAALAAYKQGGGTVAFDSNYRPRLWPDAETARQVMTEAWAVTTLALPSLDDEIALFGVAHPKAVLDRIAAAGVEEIALKRGADGPLILSDGRVSDQAFAKVDAVKDTTAAGDGFNAGYLAARITGASPINAAQSGHRIAAHVIQHTGAIVDL